MDQNQLVSQLIQSELGAKDFQIIILTAQLRIAEKRITELQDSMNQPVKEGGRVSEGK